MSGTSNSLTADVNGKMSATQLNAQSTLKKELYGYVGFANLPNQVHRKSVKKGFQFTLMVVGRLYAL